MDIILIVHLLAVVFCIGGVGFVTVVIFSITRSFYDSLEKVKLYLGLKKRFSRLARICVITVGITGLMLFWQKGGFDWIFAPRVYYVMLTFKIIV
ncbi:MAG: hypothetical protein ABIL77_01660 [candidate division WOR-3 bacterium]